MKTKKFVKMSKDAFSIYLTLAFLVGVAMPGTYTLIVMRWG